MIERRCGGPRARASGRCLLSWSSWRSASELVGPVGVAVLAAEYEVVVVPGSVGCPAFVGLPGLVYRQRGDRALEKFQRALGLGRLGVAALASRAPDVDHSLLRSTWS